MRQGIYLLYLFNSNKLLNEIFKYAFCVTKMCSQQRAFKMSLTRKERKKNWQEPRSYSLTSSICWVHKDTSEDL